MFLGGSRHPTPLLHSNIPHSSNPLLLQSPALTQMLPLLSALATSMRSLFIAVNMQIETASTLFIFVKYESDITNKCFVKLFFKIKTHLNLNYIVNYIIAYFETNKKP